VYGYVGQLTILKVLNRGLVQLWNQEVQRCWIYADSYQLSAWYLLCGEKHGC